MKHIDLFSGIGGFSLAFDNIFHEQKNEHIFCEIDPFCQAVLRKHWPDAEIHDDIRKFSGRGHSADVITGGFPCQPFSLTGKRKGKEDDRDLWPDMFRVIKECRPTWIIGENTPGIISMELDRSISDLESSGYAVQVFDIPAVAVDAPHIRHRVWIVAYTDKKLRCRLSIQSKKKWKTCKDTDACRRSKDIPDPDKKHHRHRYISAAEIHKENSQTDERRWSSVQNSKHWSTEPDVDRVAYGIPNRVDRVEALGNAIVPQVAEEIMLCIKSALAL